MTIFRKVDLFFNSITRMSHLLIQYEKKVKLITYNHIDYIDFY